ARERLVVAALQLFSEQGYDETTVAVIADRAGLTKSTFHQSRAPRVAGSTRRASRAACSERQHHTDKGRHSAGSGHPTSRMSAADLLAAGRPRHEAAVLGSTSRPALSARDCRPVWASCWPEGPWTALPTGMGAVRRRRARRGLGLGGTGQGAPDDDLPCRSRLPSPSSPGWPPGGCNSGCHQGTWSG